VMLRAADMKARRLNLNSFQSLAVCLLHLS
jgi:hypothetical protein